MEEVTTVVILFEQQKENITIIERSAITADSKEILIEHL